MTNEQCRELCFDLMKADAEEQVIAVLERNGLWEDPAAWRLYGDEPNNFSQIGNQTERSDAALVEKLVNSIDATLIGECWRYGVDPESPDAPQSIVEAVAQFFERKGETDTPGRISGWPLQKRGEIANRITVAATGATGREGGFLSLSIADMGEGQTPAVLPDTILSLNKENKVKIPFVQGKFNMGGTAALRFCGHRNLQFVLSRRNPEIADANDSTSSRWGFTLVRREDPDGRRRTSQYRYLAPLQLDGPDHGGILNFDEESIPIFPKGSDAYARLSTFGTLVKLYEYEPTGYSKSHVLRRGGLLGRLDLLLAEAALPVRVHECRGFEGHSGSFDTPLTGLAVRLDDDRAENLELAPITYPLRISDQSLTVRIFAFRSGKGETYAKREGVIFTVDGQTHGHLSRDFFKRQRVGMGFLANSLLVIVDCSRISGRSREDLFMNSRDRLSDTALRHEIESQLMMIIREDQELRLLKAKRKEQDIKLKLVDQRPLEDVLRGVLKHSPSLSALLLKGQRLSNPFDSRRTGSEGKFKGKRFPTIFHFRERKPGDVLERGSPINSRPRIQFQTDVQNDYFGRKHQRGEFQLLLLVEGIRKDVSDYAGPRLDDGIASITIALPSNCDVGDVLEYVSVVDDRSRVDPIENSFKIKVEKFRKPGEGGERKKRRRGESKRNGDDGAAPEGFALPKTHIIYEDQWNSREPSFDKRTALRVVNFGGAKPQWVFYVNGDNLYLKTEQKGRDEDAKLLEAQFVFGMVLLGMALLHDDASSDSFFTLAKPEKEGRPIDDRVESFTRAISPVLIPIIRELGDLQPEAE